MISLIFEFFVLLFFFLCVCVGVCVLCCCSCCSFAFVFAICLGFYFSASFLYFSFFFLISLATLCSFRGLGSLATGQAWASVVGAQSPACWTTREFPGPGNINWSVLCWRYPYQHQDMAPLNCLQALVLDTSHQTTSKT